MIYTLMRVLSVGLGYMLLFGCSNSIPTLRTPPIAHSSELVAASEPDQQLLDLELHLRTEQCPGDALNIRMFRQWVVSDESMPIAARETRVTLWLSNPWPQHH